MSYMAGKNVMRKLPTDHKFQRMLKEMETCVKIGPTSERKQASPDREGWTSIAYISLIAVGVAGIVYLVLLHFQVI